MSRKTIICGEVVFSIEDTNVIDINNIGDLKPSQIIKRGEIKILGRESKNRWILEKHFNNYDEFEDKMGELLSCLCKHRDYIRTLSGKYEYVGIIIYLRSEYGQLGCIFSHDIISQIASLGLEMGIDILSGGMVQDE